MNMFQRARCLIKLLKEDGGSPQGNQYFTFKFGDGVEIPISLIKEEGVGTKIKCKCQHHSIRGNEYICSYQVALILYKAGIR